jgi:hypothetical protein
VTQPLLYRYFPTKSSFIEAVYDVLYVGRWDADWVRLLADSTMPLRERLNVFYKRYSATVPTPRMDSDLSVRRSQRRSDQQMVH